jgi:type II secretory pathway pseudopilin PulG
MLEVVVVVLIVLVLLVAVGAVFRRWVEERTGR